MTEIKFNGGFNLPKGLDPNRFMAELSAFLSKKKVVLSGTIQTFDYEDAEIILIEILKMRLPITVDDIKQQKDTTKLQPARYTKKFIEKTVNARIKSNNPYFKFTEEDGAWIIDKRKIINALPEYKRRQLAKELKIKPFSPTAVSSADLKKQLLAHPEIEDVLYVLSTGIRKDNQ